ncbi:MAG: OmpA family protein [Balneolaceae bacterium]|nr:OmpA family protein [Balneolaceae bacterium]
MNNQPDLNLGVVGHTDTVGGLEFNMNLSERRASAVVEYLTSEHNISETRLTSHGVGFLAPEATNETEEGRALTQVERSVAEYVEVPTRYQLIIQFF